MSKTIVEDKLKVDCDAVIHEIELDSTWRENYSEPFRKYRKDFEVLKENNPMGDDLPDFPISIEIESSYFCNLKCPFCPRVVNEGEREIKHIPEELWEKILNEIRENNLPSLLMDHEGESLMNPKLISMIKQAKEAGVLDIWLHTNGNLLHKKKAEELIDAGLTKVNFSIDAGKPNTYEVLRLGGKLDKVTKNINDLLEVKKEKEAHHLRVRVSFCLQEKNIDELKLFYDQWKNKVNMITYQDVLDFSVFDKPDNEMDLTEEELDASYKEKEQTKFVCNQPWQTPIIDVEGNVVPCGCPVREHNKDFYLGNLLKGDTIKSCWKGEKMTKLREMHLKGEYYKNPMCRVCVKTFRKSEAAALRLQKEHSIEISKIRKDIDQSL